MVNGKKSEQPNNPSNPDENLALIGELPSRTGRQLIPQIVLLLIAIGIITMLSTRDNSATLPLSSPDVTQVATNIDGPTLNYQGHNYQFGKLGDVVVIRECDGKNLPWLLRPETGDLFRFDNWASETFVNAILVRTIEGATNLRVISGPLCDQIHVDTTNGPEVVITG
tara:strand:- start:34 stop:537 length:504 start_codon:yes stop_codon:yes gene_type:complete